jgi:hypothetical protein
MKYLYHFSIACITQIFALVVSAADPIEARSEEDLKNAIIPSGSDQVITSTATGEWVLDSILAFTRDGIFSLMALLAIGMFLYIWGKLIIARWNPEEFKKALMSFVYAVIWIFVVAAAWAIVRLVAGINL